MKRFRSRPAKTRHESFDARRGREARDKTTHYSYRQACGDARRYGSPFNVLLEPAALKKEGEVVAEKAWVVGGEMIEKDVEQFIRQRLGLDEKVQIEACKDAPRKF